VNYTDPAGHKKISLRAAGLIIDGILLIINITSAVLALKATLKLAKLISKQAVNLTKKKLLQKVKSLVGCAGKAFLGFGVNAVSAIASYVVNVIFDWSLGYAIAYGIYKFVPKSHKFLTK
jgi:hypothetical protein